MEREFGTDIITKNSVIILVLFLIGLIFLAFYKTNVPSIAEVSFTYLVLGILVFVIWAVSKLIKQKDSVDFPNPVIFENETTFFGKISPRMNGIITLAIFIFALIVFFSISGKTGFQIVAAPQYQAVEADPTVASLLSVFAAWTEDLFFFGCMTAVVFGVSYMLSRNFWASFVTTLFITPLIFMGFHFFRYGFTALISTESVLIFGFLMVSYVLMMRDLRLPLFIHASNNAALTLVSMGVYIPNIFGIIIAIAVSIPALLIIMRRS